MSASPPIDAFLELSRVLTGEERLSENLAGEYYERIREVFGDRLDALLTTFRGLSGKGDSLAANVRTNIMPDDEIGPVAREVIMLWYMSGFRAPDGNGKSRELGPQTPEQYFQGLLWPTIRAHPLGLSGGYFGYWHYPPEN